MTVPVLVVVAVFAAAFTKLNAVILGRPVTIPLLMLVFAVVLLALAVVLAAIVRGIIPDGGLRFSRNEDDVTGQDTAAMLRDLTEAVAVVAGRLLGLSPEDAGDETEGPSGKRT